MFFQKHSISINSPNNRINNDFIYYFRFTEQQLNKCIASCDERIASLQENIDTWNGIYQEIIEDDKNVFRYASEIDTMKNYENKNKNHIQLFKTEKLCNLQLFTQYQFRKNNLQNASHQV